MCGIVGYVGPRQATPIIFDGLKRLEYRGYDSAGIAVIGLDERIGVRRDVGKLSNLERKLAEQPLEGCVGIGHTRWATHGSPSETNAHPHTDCSGDLVVIHNGIVENFSVLRQELTGQGHTFASETDTEVIVHLVEQNMLDGQSFEEAARAALLKLKGAQAVVLMDRQHPDRLIASRIGNAGGVICAAVEYGGGTQAQALERIRDSIRANTAEVLECAANEGTTPRRAAVAMAEARVRRAMGWRRWR